MWRVIVSGAGILAVSQLRFADLNSIGKTYRRPVWGRPIAFQFQIRYFFSAAHSTHFMFVYPSFTLHIHTGQSSTIGIHHDF